jgi:hypothetical protein
MSKVPLRILVEAWKSRTVHLARIEYIICYSQNDFHTANYCRNEYSYFLEQSKIFFDFRVNETPSSKSVTAVQNWNYASNLAKGEILFVVSDDILPEHGWDVELEKLISSNDIGEKIVWKIQDKKCLQLDDGGLLLRHPIMTKPLVNNNLGIFDTNFLGRGADDYLTYQSLKNRHLKEIKSFKIHHAFGNIIDRQGELNCGCNSKTNSSKSKLSESQELISATKLAGSNILNKLTSPYFKIWGPLIFNEKYWKRVVQRATDGKIILRNPFFVLIQRFFMFIENRI